jgi:hypothetical protein
MYIPSRSPKGIKVRYGDNAAHKTTGKGKNPTDLLFSFCKPTLDTVIKEASK